MTFKEQIGRNIKKAREKLGLTQTKVADRAGINMNYYSRIERGEVNVSVEKLYHIIKVLKTNSSKILPF
jgi:transcriptional regulator with XRE-family HTH domain